MCKSDIAIISLTSEDKFLLSLSSCERCHHPSFRFRANNLNFLSWVNRVLLDSLDAAYEKLGLPAVERKEMRTDILNGKEVLRQTIIEPEGVTIECVYLGRRKDMISICLQGSPISEEHREEFDQMLKTFRPME